MADQQPDSELQQNTIYVIGQDYIPMGRVTDADAKRALGDNVAPSKQTVLEMKAKIQGNKDKGKSWARTVGGLCPIT